MSQRLRDWQSRFAACLAERRARLFAWGSHDCALFVSDCVGSVAGYDPAADLRGTYSDAAGAARVIREHGGLAAIAAARLGAEIPPELAQPGDVGLCESNGRELLAVCAGDMWVGPGIEGLDQMPIGAASRAWRCTKDEGKQ